MYLEETNLFPACMRSKASFIFSSRIVRDISLSRFIFPAIYCSDSLGIISHATHPPNNKTWKKDRNAFFLAGLGVCNSNNGPIVFTVIAVNQEEWKTRTCKLNQVMRKRGEIFIICLFFQWNNLAGLEKLFIQCWTSTQLQEYALLCTTLQHAHVATLFKGKGVRSLLVCHYNNDSYLLRLIRLYSFPSANDRDLLIVVLVRRQL